MGRCEDVREGGREGGRSATNYNVTRFTQLTAPIALTSAGHMMEVGRHTYYGI